MRIGWNMQEKNCWNLNHVIQIVDNFIFHGGDNNLLIT
jgi:hypothetical protein